MKLGRRLVAVGAAVATAALLLGSSGCSLTSKYGDSFRFPLSAEPIQLDPQVAADAASVEVLHALMAGLTRLDDSGEPVADMAESWECSDDGLTWTFHLREAAWSDGRAITAADFVYGWQRAVDPSTVSSLTGVFTGIRGAAAIIRGTADVSTLGVTATDAHTLTVELTEPDEDFLTRVADTPFFPCNEEFFLSTQGRYGLEEEDVLSNGAFTLSTWEHDTYLIVGKNDTYYAADSILPSRVRFVIATVEDVVQALSEGELDASELTAEQAAAARAAGLPVVEVNDSVGGLWFNTSVSWLSDASVRVALRDALEWSLIDKQLADSDLTRATGYVSPDTQWEGGSYREQATACRWATDQQSTAAKALKNKERPSLTVLCADDDDSIRLAQYVVQSWQKNLDLYFSLRSLPADELASRIAVGNYEIALGEVAGASGQVAGALEAFASTGSENVTRLTDATYAKLVASASTLADWEACEQRLTALCPCVPLWFSSRQYGTGADVTGLVIHPFGGAPYGVIYDFWQADK